MKLITLIQAGALILLAVFGAYAQTDTTKNTTDTAANVTVVSEL